MHYIFEHFYSSCTQNHSSGQYRTSGMFVPWQCFMAMSPKTYINTVFAYLFFGITLTIAAVDSSCSMSFVGLMSPNITCPWVRVSSSRAAISAVGHCRNIVGSSCNGNGICKTVCYKTGKLIHILMFLVLIFVKDAILFIQIMQLPNMFLGPTSTEQWV